MKGKGLIFRGKGIVLESPSRKQASSGFGAGKEKCGGKEVT